MGGFTFLPEVISMNLFFLYIPAAPANEGNSVVCVLHYHHRTIALLTHFPYCNKPPESDTKNNMSNLRFTLES